MGRYLTIDDVDVDGLNVLVRSDLNVPMEDGEVVDDFRIRAALPTLETLVSRGASVSVCSHLGRPKGIDPFLSMAAIVARMELLTDFEVGFVDGGQITVLENTRFHEGETTNDPDVAAVLAEGIDLFVEDAFGSVHRAHASTVGVAELVRSVSGPLLTSELEALGRFLGEPESPYSVVLGGAKVSDKLGVIENLLPRVDRMLIGGGMCFTFIRAMGGSVGASLVEESMVQRVDELMHGPDGAKVLLPTDILAADSFRADAETQLVNPGSVPDGWIGLDIGPDSSSAFGKAVVESSNVFWNGPMGVFEWEPFRYGTEAVARAMTECEGFTAVGGGDSAAALRLLGLDTSVSHMSTGGGAGLELLEGRVLPGVAVLERWTS